MHLPVINLVHVFFVAPLLYYVGTTHDRSNFMKSFLMILAALVLAYHAFLASQHPHHAMINWIHILFVAPLLFYVGYAKSVQSGVFNFLVFLSLVVFVYHGYRALMRMGFM